MRIHALPKCLTMLFLIVAASSVLMAQAQAPTPPSASVYTIPYGPAISLDTAKKVADGAIEEARKNGWFMAAAVVDPNGALIYFEKMDNTEFAAGNLAISKGRSVALYKRPTKAFQDALASGGLGLRVLGLEGAVPVEGGLPLMMEGKIVGAIGVSGDLSEHDAQCARAGVALLK